MNLIQRIILSIVGLAVVVTAAYFLLKSERTTTIIFPEWLVGAQVHNTAETLRQKGFQIMDGAVGSTIQKGKDAINTIIEDVVGKAKSAAYNSVKDTVDQKLVAVGRDLGVSGAGTASPALSIGGNVSDDVPFGFTVKAGVPAIFVIKNPDTIKGTANFTIQWGDGKKDDGVVAESAVKTLFHIWEKSGEYAIAAVFKAGDVSRTYSFSIIVTL